MLRFRGVRAAASLKRQKRAADDLLDTLFPRRACRGLIEARSAAPSWFASEEQRFRGVRAAASLKLVHA